MAADKVSLWNIALSKIGADRLSTVTDETEEARVLTAIYDDVRDEALKEFAWGFAQKRVALINITVPDIDEWVAETAYAVDDVAVYSSVHYTCLIAHTSSDFATDLAAVDWETTTDWVTATQYILGDQIYSSGVSYTCVTAHTSGVFATDLTAEKWVLSSVLNMDDDNIAYIYQLPSDFLKLTLTSDSNAIIKLEGTRLLSDTEDLKIKYTYQNDTPSTYTSEFTMALATKLAYETCFNLVESANKAEALLAEYEQVRLPKAMSIESQQGTPVEPRCDEWEIARGSGTFETYKGSTWHPY